MKKRTVLLTTSLILAMTFVASWSFADDGTVLSPQDFLSQVIAFIQSWGGLTTLLKASGVILLVIATMKVTYLNTLIWSKLGAAQTWAAPVLGLLAGILGLGTGGAPLTAALVFTYVSAGAGAVFLHEILDTVKAIPGIGSLWVTIIDLIEGALGGPAAQEKALLPK